MPTMVEIASQDAKITAACVVEPPTKAKATKKGLKVLLYTWLGAIATIPIPIVHFITVPAAVLIGPILGFLIYRTALTRANITCPDATCPKCRNALPLTFSSDVQTFERSCKGCGASLNVRTLAAVASS